MDSTFIRTELAQVLQQSRRLLTTIRRPAAVKVREKGKVREKARVRQIQVGEKAKAREKVRENGMEEAILEEDCSKLIQTLKYLL